MILTAERKKVKCYHCGDLCFDQEIYLEDKSFCCSGCKTVYEILNEHSMCEYYALENHPGKKLESHEVNESKFDFLNDESICNQLLNFQDGTICGVTFFIPAVHCSSCIWLLEHLTQIQPGITKSNIVFQSKQLDIQFDKSKVSLVQIAQLLDRLGYSPEITMEGKPVNAVSISKTLFYKIGVAGFGFGNIMLLSISDYVSFFNDFNDEFKSFFSFISLFLALPVFFYSAGDYFTSSWTGIRNKMINIDFPIALGLTAAFGLSLIEIISGTGMGYLDSLTGLIFFLLIGKWYQRKTFDAISFQRDYQSYFPLAATVIRNEKEEYISLKELNPGDLVLVRNQEVIPADGLLEEGNASIDYSFVTGESTLSTKQTGDQLYAGGRQSGETIRVRVLKKVSESYLTQLWNTDRSGKTEESGLAHFTNQVGIYFTIAVLLTALVTYGVWYPSDPAKALQSALAVLIIFCPCTLALAIPFCFGNAMNIMSKNGFYLKNTATIEKLSDIETIVFDKTGTITSSGLSDIYFSGALTEEEEQCVRSLVAHSGHPLSRLLAQHLVDYTELPVTAFKEVVSKGVSGIVNGKTIKLGSAGFIGINKPVAGQLETEVYVSVDGEIKGRYVFKNSYREGIPEMLRQLDRKYDLHLLSGDNDAQLEMMQHYFPPANIHFNQSPTDKLSYMKAQEAVNKTMMVGDGLNDAGALMESNCGVAVSESSASFSPACDAILDVKELHRLPEFISYSRACVHTVRLSLLVSLIYNFIGLSFACFGLLTPLTAAILMPLSSVSVVLFVTLVSNLLARKYHLK